MKRKRGEPAYAEASDPEEEDSEGKSESLEVTGSEASDSGEEGDTDNTGSESEEESEEEDAVRSRILTSITRTPESRNVSLSRQDDYMKLYRHEHLHREWDADESGPLPNMLKIPPCRTLLASTKS